MSTKFTRKQAVLLGALGLGVAAVVVINLIDFSSGGTEAEAHQAARAVADEMRAQVPPEQVDPAPAVQPSPAAPSRFGR